MQYVNKYTLLLLWLVSTLSYSQGQQDCLSIQDDYVSLIESGKYRFSNKLAKDSSGKFLASVNFKKLSSYQQYLNDAYQVIVNTNPRANMPCPIVTETYRQLAKQKQWSKIPTISQLLAPFELAQPNNDKAILLIHGLTDSPFYFHDLSQFFYQQGFTVRTLLLPGHGMAPSALLTTDYSEWQQATTFAIEQTLTDYQQVYLGGLSTGGTLIFNYLMQKNSVDEKIKGLFMWSPASKAKSDLAWLAQYIDAIPFVDWLDLDADIDFAKYESFPYNAAAQVHALMSLVGGDQAMASRNMHDIPVFVVASEYDQTIATESTLQLIQQWQLASPQEKMKQSVLIYYGDNNKLTKKLAEVMSVVVPECSADSLCSDIFDVAHIATTNSPDNPHYGVNGRYRNCGHYVKDAVRYQACKQNKQVIKGEVTAMNLKHELPIQRLTYNPYYQEMLADMAKFLQVTQQSVSD
ncbi:MULTISPECIES: alpha/beta hydrolase [Colwellia]|uniref:Lipoprotein n=1 Tax=Colwellia marinimaniae TaxID=1513592 RepID=A0ABQ0MRG8_9GAMM|nr:MULTISPECIES: alpha/beta fold hydrolase [Colwellia]GAW94969.1 lipoprotein [Colwellia marinimaniae]